MKPTKGGDLVGRDRRVLWHPFTQHGLGLDPLGVESARGAYLHLAGGRAVLDAISSWWVTLLGHAHPAIAEAIASQSSRLEQVIFAGFTHEPAVTLGEILITAARERGLPMQRVFYSDDGSTAVEVALKIAYQAHINQGVTTRRRFIALSNAYHGDTLGAMTVGEPSGFHAIFRPLLPEVDFIEPGDAAGLARALDMHPRGHAAMIVEPMIQGAGGMLFHEAGFLRDAARLCREAGVYLICDEVFTGFYRTGRCFAVEHAGIEPDLITLSKGLTGGFLPLAATLATEGIFDAFRSEDRAKTFLHGHSYTANPIACAAGVASWRELMKPEHQERIRAIAERTGAHIDRLASHPRLRNARHLGTIGAVDIAGAPDYFSKVGPLLFQEAIRRNVLLRPLGNVLYAVPPYCVTDDEVDTIYKTMGEILEAVPGVRT